MQIKRKEYKNRTEEVRERIKAYSRHGNAVYWTAILNMVSLIILLFREEKTYSLGYGINIFLHRTFLTLSIDVSMALLLSGLCAFLVSIVFVGLAIFVKKGKLIPLIITLCLYAGDFVIVMLLPSSYFYDSGWNQSLAFFTHSIACIYFIYLAISYYKIVHVSKINTIMTNGEKQAKAKLENIENKETEN